MAQDFAAAFGVGEDDRHISTVDADGVALAAIQELYALAQQQDAQLVAQQPQITTLQEQNATLESRLSALERAIQNGGVAAGPVEWSLVSGWGITVLALGGLAGLFFRRRL